MGWVPNRITFVLNHLPPGLLSLARPQQVTEVQLQYWVRIAIP